MLSRLMEALFGCWHARYSFPITVRPGSRRGSRVGTYVVCLDCGKELSYDWREMRVVEGRKGDRGHALVTKEAA